MMAELTSILSEEKQTVEKETVEKETEEKEQDVHSAEIIANQAEKIFRRGRPWRKRRDTFFYTIVLGGNTQTIEQTVQYMQRLGMDDVLSWLLRRKNGKKLTNFLNTCKSCLGRFTVFSILLLVNFLITPVFYIIHSLTCSLCSKLQKQISKDIRLPLAYAVFSQKKEMWQYFLSFLGVSIMDSDSEGNNVFHYIADLSAESPDRAVTMFKTLMENTSDMDTMKALIVEQANFSGLSALEYTAKFGSPVLLSEILHHPNLLQHSVLKVQEGMVSFSTEDNTHGVDTLTATRIDHVNVSKYECGELVHQSSLLHLLSDRNLMGMNQQDLKLFQNATVLHTWMSLKVKQMITKVVSLHTADIVVTCMLFVFSTMFIQFNWIVIEENSDRIFQSELKALGENTSYIFKPDAYPVVLERIRHHYQRQILDFMAEEDRRDLLQKTSMLHPELGENITINLDDARTLDAVVKTALKKNDANWMKFYIILHLRDFLVSYARYVHSHVHRSRYDQEKITYNTSITHGNFSFELQTVVDTMPLLDNICVSTLFFTLDDIHTTSQIDADVLETMDACKVKAHMELSGDKCLYMSHSEAFKELSTRETPCSPCFILLPVILLSLFSYFIIDLFERCCFTYLAAAQRRGICRMLKASFGIKIPGSYVRKQMNILSVLFCVASAGTFSVSSLFSKYSDLFTMLTLVIRFIMHIHSLRLLPGIGHFVVTMFKMGTNLLHFSAIYGIVIFIFSIVFNKILINPGCPAERFDGFTTLPDSMLSTLSLASGYGEVNAFYGSTTAKVTYVLYLVIVGLLLMNLIIAIMSSTATDVMREPWKEVLWHMEWLKEALSAEFTFAALSLSCRGCCKGCYITHHKVGYIVEKDERNVVNIYIPITSCPQLC